MTVINRQQPVVKSSYAGSHSPQTPIDCKMARGKTAEQICSTVSGGTKDTIKFVKCSKKPSLNSSDVIQVSAKSRRRKPNKDKPFTGNTKYRFLQVIPPDFRFDELDRRKIAEELLEQVSNNCQDLQTELSCMFPHFADSTIHDVIAACQSDSLKCIDSLLELSNGAGEFNTQENDWMLIGDEATHLDFDDQGDDTVLISMNTSQPYLSALLKNL